MPVLELTDNQVISLLNQIPQEQIHRILFTLNITEKNPLENSVQISPIIPQFGSAKDDILFMASDFDAPLEDFKEYM